PAALRVLAGHDGPILSVAAHPNGARVYTASADKSIKAFDLNNGNVLQTLKGHTDAVRAVAVTRDGIKVVSGSSGRRIRVWPAADGKPVLTIPALPAGVASVAVPGRTPLAAAALADGIVKVYDLAAGDATQAESASFRGSPRALTAVAFLPDSSGLLAASPDQVVEVWPLPTAGAARTFTGHSGQVYGVAWSPESKW